jgi:hypothetical protein
MENAETKMSIIEVGDDGSLRVPGELLAGAKPHTKYALDVSGDAIVLRPAESDKPLWEIADPLERAEVFRRWANQPRPPAPDIPLEYLDREYIY